MATLWGRSRRLRRHVVTSPLTLLIFLVTAGPAQAAPVPPCINYTHAEEGGHIYVDLRFDPNTGHYTTLTIFLFVNDPGAAPGTYYWNHVLNGRPGPGHFELDKDDNFHTILRMNDPVDHWAFGDHYKMQATHYSPVTRKSYVAAYNECVITPR
jgi:hypothetical protein